MHSCPTLTLTLTHVQGAAAHTLAHQGAAAQPRRALTLTLTLATTLATTLTLALTLTLTHVQGEGVRMLHSLEEITPGVGGPSPAIIVQQYIGPPLLVRVRARVRVSAASWEAAW